MKSLVEDIYRRKFAERGFKVGYQSQELIKGGYKSPFFLRELVVSTLDSFILNLYKAPVAEYHKIIDEVSLGHYYVPLSSILTSTVVFDEAHMYLGEVDESISVQMVYAAITTLSDLGVPVVVETATMNTRLVEKIAERMKVPRGVQLVYVVCNENSQVAKLKNMRAVELHLVCDEEYEERNLIEWKTSLIRNHEVVDKALKALEEGRIVLVVRNTVGKAIETYRQLLSRLGREGDGSIVLIHGRLSGGDRKRAVERMEMVMENGGIVVSTQVVEAGVEINADVLITDSCPIENLAQRTGRLCREGARVFSDCRERGGEVYIIEPDSVENKKIDVYDSRRVINTVKAVKKYLADRVGIDWRLLGSRVEGRRSFVEILEEVEPPGLEESIVDRVYEDLLRNYLEADESFEVFKRMHEIMGKKPFFRSTIQLKLAFQHGGEYDFVSVDWDWFAKLEEKLIEKTGSGCLDYGEDGKARVLGFEYVNGKEQPVVKPSRFITREKMKKGKLYLDSPLDLYRVEGERGIARFTALLLNKECYEPGIGLVFPLERGQMQ